jgi:hypothetical protein
MADTNDDSAGSSDDAISAFTAALETAGKAAVAQTTGDLTVIAAIELGWLLRELAHNWPLNPQPAGIELLTGEWRKAQANGLTAQITALKLTELTAETKAVSDMVNALNGDPDDVEPGPLDPTITKALVSAVRVALVGAGAKYVSAYVLGDGMRAIIPDEDEEAIGPTPAMISALDMLSSALPSHAARSVANSMSLWERPDGDPNRSLRVAQVALWRAVIVGEKKGTELLEPKDYLKAAGELEHKYFQQIAAGRPFRVIAASASVLFGAGILALCLETKTGVTLAGISGVLAALGLTWKGIGGTVGEIVGKLETPVWGAELDTAITDVITLTRISSNSPADALSYGNRRARLIGSSNAIHALGRGSAPAEPDATQTGAVEPPPANSR